MADEAPRGVGARSSIANPRVLFALVYIGAALPVQVQLVPRTTRAGKAAGSVEAHVVARLKVALVNICKPRQFKGEEC